MIEISGGSKVVSTTGQAKWTVSRRFRLFFSLHEQVLLGVFVFSHFLFPLQLKAKSQYKNILPEGPTKKVIGAKTPEFIEERRKLLHSYVTQLIKLPMLLDDEHFCQFFDLQRMNYFETFDKSGYLWKQGVWNPAFKRRWCIAKDGFIYYFRGDKVFFNSSPSTPTISNRNPGKWPAQFVWRGVR